MVSKLTFAAFACLALVCNAEGPAKKVVCYYDSVANFRQGQAQFQNIFFENALQYCTHLIYGYAGIDAESHKLISLNKQFDINHENFRQVTSLKHRYPHLKVFLSVGGGRDPNPRKYLTLLETTDTRLAFINSALTMVKLHGFDGLDLAWEFPPNKPKKYKSALGNIWSSVKHVFVSPKEIDEQHEEHREQFTALVRELRNTFRQDGLFLSMSVLPNVNSSIFHDVRALMPSLEFVNLWAFDYHTPESYPEEADYPAPLHMLADRRFDENGDYLVNYWLEHGSLHHKVIYGIPTYGRTWKMIHDSGLTGVPPMKVKGMGEPGPYTKIGGFLSYQEVCAKISNYSNRAGSALRKVGDPSGKHGAYAFHLPDDSGDGGMWVGYEDPDSAAHKAAYVKSKGLGGIAVVDITLDDFRGLCTGYKYPILYAVKSRL